MRAVPPALWYLMRLQWGARLRRLRQRLSTPKGAVSLFVIVLFVGLWAYSLVLSTMQSDRAVRLSADAFATGMSSLLLISLLSTSWDQGLGFRPDEIAFLFPGPFTRRELLRYRMVRDAVSLLLTSIPMGLFVGVYAGTWFGAFLGMFLSLCCFNLVQMLFGIAGATVSHSLIARGRTTLLVLVLLLAGVSVAFTLSGPSADAGGLLQTPFLRALRVPFLPFANLISGTEYFPDLAGWCAASTAILIVLAACILRLDSRFEETAIAASQRTMERLERMRHGQIGWELSPKGSVRVRIPQLPRMGGAGPIAWHQLTRAIRSLKGMTLFLVMMLAAFAWPHFTFLRNDDSGEIASSALPVGVMFSLFFLPQYLRYDFRGDIERIPYLKSLPIRPLPLVLGELVVPVLALSLLQIAVCGGFAVAGAIPLDRMGTIVFFAPLANALIFGLENIVFLLYPISLPTPGRADLDAFPRQMLFIFLKLLILGLTVGVCAGVGALAWVAFDHSIRAAIVAAWLTAASAVVIMVLATVAAFQAFDASADMPA